MKLNDTATEQGIFQSVDFLCGTNSSSYSIPDKTRNANNWHDFCVVEILDAMDEWDFNADWGVANLSATQQEYSFPSDLLKIKRVEVDLNNDGKYVVARPFDPGSHDDTISASAEINNQFNTSKPYYDVFDDSLFLYPVPDVASNSGLKIWYTKNVSQFTAMDTGWANSALIGNSGEPAFERSFHKIIPLGMSLDYAVKYDIKNLVKYCEDELYGKAVKGKERLGGIISKMKAFYSTRASDKIIRIKSKYFKDNYK